MTRVIPALATNRGEVSPSFGGKAGIQLDPRLKHAGMTRASLALVLPRAGLMKNQPGMTYVILCRPREFSFRRPLFDFAAAARLLRRP